MTKQVKIIFEQRKEHTPLTYASLTIDQKVNIKANSCGFQLIWLRSMLPWKRLTSGFIYRDDTYNRLTERWKWHHKTNDKHRITLKGRLDLI